MNDTVESHLSSRERDLTHAIAELCIQIPVSGGPAALTRELHTIAPDLAFRETLERGGWYRLGGVVAADGSRVADDLQSWAEQQLAARDDDLHALWEDYADSGLQATRIAGKTHYLVAATGSEATSFIQIEVEELQETVCKRLFDGDSVPSNLEQLIDNRSNCATAPTPIGTSFYALRRVTDIAAFLRRMQAQKPEPQAVHRFVDCWEKSSAGSATQLSNHWVIVVREHLDRYRQSILNATPVAAINGAPPRFEIPYGAQGLTLHAALQSFDRQAGYPMAWFFHMLTTKAVPHAVATAVINDVQVGFHYLPDRDSQVVRDWMHRPFGF
jgi:hypothetical protein